MAISSQIFNNNSDIITFNGIDYIPGIGPNTYASGSAVDDNGSSYSKVSNRSFFTFTKQGDSINIPYTYLKIPLVGTQDNFSSIALEVKGFILQYRQVTQTQPAFSFFHRVSMCISDTTVIGSSFTITGASNKEFDAPFSPLNGVGADTNILSDFTDTGNPIIYNTTDNSFDCKLSLTSTSLQSSLVFKGTYLLI
jgi:hypothetical protein